MKKLVVVDDESIVIQGIKAIIDRLNISVDMVDYATNGLDGRNIIRERKPDIVITDIRMPGMDGLSMIEELKSELIDTKFVIISGYTDFVYTKQAIQLDVVDYIDKPITIEKIKNVFEEINRKDMAEKKPDANDTFPSDELVISALILGKANEFVDYTNDYLKLLSNTCEKEGEFKEQCYRFLSFVQEIYAGSRKKYDETMIIPCEQLMGLTSREEVLSYVKKNIHRIASQMEAKDKGTNHHVITQLLQFINENYQKDIGLTELAESVNMNPAYLSILFKEEVGSSYVKYITELRIDKAKKYLLEGRKISEVSSLVGYNNYRYFCDIFKKHVGMTPSEYRNKS